jgi:hypothetical protein
MPTPVDARLGWGSLTRQQERVRRFQERPASQASLDALQAQAHRAEAVAALVASEHWWAIQEIFKENFDDLLAAVMAKQQPPEVLNIIQAVYEDFDRTLRLGADAMKRLYEKQAGLRTRLESERAAGTDGLPSSP